MRMKPPARTLLIEWDPRGIRRIADATPWWTRALIWLARALAPHPDSHAHAPPGDS